MKGLPSVDRSALNAQLLQAHSQKDGPVLIALYTEAGSLMEQAGDVDAACFYLTQAFVYALELDAPQLTALHARLSRHGRVQAL